MVSAGVLRPCVCLVLDVGVLMTRMFAHTGSLLLAVLMHASFTSWLLVLFPATSFEQGLAWQITLAAGLWLVVAVVVGASTHSWGRKCRDVR